MLGTAIRTREQSVFAVERDWADGALDGVVVEFDAAIVDEPRQPFPARQGIADGIGELALLTDQTKFCPQPRLKRVNQRMGFLLPDNAALVGAAATDVFLDGIDSRNVGERFARDRRRTWGSEFVKVAAYMRPAERKPDVAPLGELAVAGIAIDLQDALEAGIAPGNVEIGEAALLALSR